MYSGTISGELLLAGCGLGPRVQGLGIYSQREGIEQATAAAIARSWPIGCRDWGLVGWLCYVHECARNRLAHSASHFADFFSLKLESHLYASRAS